MENEVKNEAKKIERPNTKDLIIGLWRENGAIKKLRKEDVVPLEIVGQQLDAVDDTLKIMGAIISDADKTIKELAEKCRTYGIAFMILSIALLLAGLQLWGII